ncbi:MAG: hypothetical protein FWF31_09505 [Desulfobulbus sp.]|nr:hypothetical protein [Desulfobulbus sp.]
MPVNEFMPLFPNFPEAGEAIKATRGKIVFQVKEGFFAESKSSCQGEVFVHQSGIRQSDLPVVRGRDQGCEGSGTDLRMRCAASDEGGRGVSHSGDSKSLIKTGFVPPSPFFIFLPFGLWPTPKGKPCDTYFTGTRGKSRAMDFLGICRRW